MNFLLFVVKMRYRKKQTKKRFCFFNSRNFDVKNSSCSGRPITKRVAQFTVENEQGRLVSDYDIVKELNIHQH